MASRDDIFHGHLEYDRSGQALLSSTSAVAIVRSGLSSRIAHTVRHVARLQTFVHLTHYHWTHAKLWLQEVHVWPRAEQIDVRIDPPLPALGPPKDQSLLEIAMAHAEEVILVTEAQPLELPGPRVVYANAAFTQMTGYEVDEIIGRTPRILQGEGTEAEVLQQIRRSLNAWRPIRAVLTNYRKDGSPFVVDLDIRPHADGTGWFTHWVAIQRDVTANRLAQVHRLRHEHLETISTLSGGIAHDFNNYLMGIVGNLDLARQQVTPETELARQLADAEGSALRCIELTNQLLSFSREAATMNSSVVDLRVYLQTLAQEALRPWLERLDFRLGSESLASIKVEADESQLAEALRLVVRHALERESIERLSIQLVQLSKDHLPEGLEPGPTYVELRFFEDQGDPSPTPQELPKFFQSPPRADHTETNLGLALSWAIIRMHKGRLDLGVGAPFTVRVYLPTAHSSEGLPPYPAKSKERPSPLRVLWMDDEPMVRTVAQRQGKRLGWSLQTLTRGEEVLECFRRERPDMLILDITVKGGMGGYETLREIRSMDKQLPVLLASGWSSENPQTVIEDDPATGFLAKPFRSGDLERAVAELMARRKV